MSVIQLSYYGALYDLSVAASKKLESAKPLFSIKLYLVKIFIFMACASLFAFYETMFIFLWSTVFQLFNFKVDSSFEFFEFSGNGILLFLCFDTLKIKVIIIFLHML